MNASDPQTSRRNKNDSDEAIDVGFLTKSIAGISILVVILALVGQVELMIGMIVAVCIGIAWWALSLQEQSMSGADRFHALRRVARLRNEDADKPRPVVVFGIAGVVGVFVCWNLSSPWKQFHASDLPMVQGKITRHEMVEIDLGSQLEVEYDYQVAGNDYQGNRLRFVSRAFRVGTDEAKKLAATWRLGNNVDVFYNPDSPDDCLLDNTFCKGDELQIGLNATALMLSMMVMFGAATAHLRGRQSEIVRDDSDGIVAIALSNVPLLGSFAVFIAVGSLVATFIALMAGMISMGDGEIPWLVTTIDHLYIVTGTIFAIGFTIFLGERASFGLHGRHLVIDNLRKTISWPSETFGEKASVDLAQVKSVRVVSNREDWYRMGRTFSVAVLHSDNGSNLRRTIVERSYIRGHAVALASEIQGIVSPRSHEIPDSEERQTIPPDSTRIVNVLDAASPIHS